MEKNVAHGGWTTSLLTVAGQHGGSVAATLLQAQWNGRREE